MYICCFHRALHTLIFQFIFALCNSQFKTVSSEPYAVFFPTDISRNEYVEFVESFDFLSHIISNHKRYSSG